MTPARIAVLGVSRGSEAATQARSDGGRRMKALGTAAQYRGVAGLEAKPAGVGGDVRP